MCILGILLALKDIKMNQQIQLAEAELGGDGDQNRKNNVGVGLCSAGFTAMHLETLQEESSKSDLRTWTPTNHVAVNIKGFSAGSYTGIILHRMVAKGRALMGIKVCTLVGGISIPPYYLDMKTCNLTLVHLTADRLCVWSPA